MPIKIIIIIKAIAKTAVMNIMIFVVKMVSERKLYKGVFKTLTNI